MAFTIKQHDNWPLLSLALTDQNGPIDLSTASSVKLILKQALPPTTVTGAMAISVPASAGIVTYTWAGTNTDVPGSYDGEVEITWAAGKVETVPNDGYFSVIIQSDLG